MVCSSGLASADASGIAERPQPPEVVDEAAGTGPAERGVEDLTDDDVVVAGVADPVGAALEPALGLLDERGPAVRPAGVRDAGELTDGGAAGAGEPVGGDLRLAVEDAHRPGVDVLQRLADAGVGVDAEQQHRRAQGHRGDGRGRHRQVRGAVAHRDDGDAAGQALHGGAVTLDELLVHGVLLSRARPSENQRAGSRAAATAARGAPKSQTRSEERRVGKECSSGWWLYDSKEN